jgi:hypothetical protein
VLKLITSSFVPECNFNALIPIEQIVSKLRCRYMSLIKTSKRNYFITSTSIVIGNVITTNASTAQIIFLAIFSIYLVILEVPCILVS